MIVVEEINSVDHHADFNFVFFLAVAIVLSVIFTDREVRPDEISLAVSRCESANSELHYFEIGAFRLETVCKNGAVFNDSVTLVGKK